ncbi:hypothetical protein QTP88_012203 [Uroleucon formosanum]
MRFVLNDRVKQQRIGSARSYNDISPRRRYRYSIGDIRGGKRASAPLTAAAWLGDDDDDNDDEEEDDGRVVCSPLFKTHVRPSFLHRHATELRVYTMITHNTIKSIIPTHSQRGGGRQPDAEPKTLDIGRLCQNRFFNFPLALRRQKSLKTHDDADIFIEFVSMKYL